MNILVLGNGFDLAHGLPTSYKDFLTFCKKIEALYKYSEIISQDVHIPQELRIRSRGTERHSASD